MTTNALERGFDYTVTLDLTGTEGLSTELLAAIENTIASVYAELGAYVAGDGVFDVRVEFFDDPNGSLAIALSFSAFLTEDDPFTPDGIDLGPDGGARVPVALYEFLTDVDLNDGEPDAIIRVNRHFLDDPTFGFFVDGVSTGPIGQRFDFTGTIRHEALHTLGAVQSGDASRPSLIDLRTTTDGSGDLVYIGATAQTLYGAPVPVSAPFFHFEADPAIEDDLFDFAVLDATANRGEFRQIGALELALLADIGHDVVIPDDLPLINVPDQGAPEILTPETIAVTDGAVTLTLGLSGGVRTRIVTVGVRTFVDGVEVASERLVFDPGVNTVQTTVALDGMLDDESAVTVEVFSPTNATLAGVDGRTLTRTIDLTGEVGSGAETIDVARFFNTVAGGHFFTADEGERDAVLANEAVMRFEGAGFEAFDANADDGVDVFRFFNTTSGAHFFTTSEAECDFVLENSPTYRFEGVGFRAFEEAQTDTVPVYRFFNTELGGHFFTADEAERDFVQDNLPVFRFEGVGFYAFTGDYMDALI